jgi:hypothetical protein
MRKLLIISTFACLSAISSAQMADTAKVLIPDMPVEMPKRSYFGVALGASASTNGFGGSLITQLNRTFALRLSYETIDMTFADAFTYETESEGPNNTVVTQGYKVSPTVKTGGLSAILDIYIARGLYLSAGVVKTDLNPSFKLMSSEPVMIGDIAYSPDEVGELVLAIKPEKTLAPYGAIGFGRNISRDHRLAFSMELGAYFTEAFVVDAKGTQLFAANGDPADMADLNKTLKEMEWSGIYPVLKFGLSYKIFKGKNSK